MVARVWRGTAPESRADEYFEHVTSVVFPKLRQIEGFYGGRVLRRRIATGELEFLVITEWRSLDAIRAFAGDHSDVAVVEPAARAMLSDFDEHVQHFEVAYELSLHTGER